MNRRGRINFFFCDVVIECFDFIDSFKAVLNNREILHPNYGKQLVSTLVGTHRLRQRFDEQMMDQSPKIFRIARFH